MPFDDELEMRYPGLGRILLFEKDTNLQQLLDAERAARIELAGFNQLKVRSAPKASTEWQVANVISRYDMMHDLHDFTVVDGALDIGRRKEATRFTNKLYRLVNRPVKTELERNVAARLKSYFEEVMLDGRPEYALLASKAIALAQNEDLLFRVPDVSDTGREYFKFFCRDLVIDRDQNS